MILSIICWVVADVAAIAIRNFEDKSDAATFQGPLLGKVILYIFKNSSNHIIVFLDTLLLA